MAVTYRTSNVLFNAVDFSASATSVAVLQLGAMLQASIQCQTTASAGPLVGTFAVQVSNDPRAVDPGTQSSACWTTIQSVAFSGNTNTMITWTNAHRACQAVWTFTSGTGTGSAWMYGVSV